MALDEQQEMMAREYPEIVRRPEYDEFWEDIPRKVPSRAASAMR